MFPDSGEGEIRAGSSAALSACSFAGNRSARMRPFAAADPNAFRRAPFPTLAQRLPKGTGRYCLEEG